MSENNIQIAFEMLFKYYGVQFLYCIACKDFYISWLSHILVLSVHNEIIPETCRAH